MKKKILFNLFIFFLIISCLYIFYIFRPQKIKNYNYSREIIENQTEGDIGQISSLSTKKETKIELLPKDIIIGSSMISVLIYFIFYYGSIFYFKTKNEKI